MTQHGLALRQFRARPLRTVLTVLAFALSVGLVGFLLVLNSALQEDWAPFQGQRIIVMGRGGFLDKLPEAYLTKVEDVPGIHALVPFTFFLGFYRDTKPENQIPVNGTDERLIEVYKEANIPKDQAKEWLADPRGALIGGILHKRFGWKPGDHVVVQAPVPGGSIDFTIRAVMNYQNDNGVYLHRKYFDGVTGEHGQIGMIWIMAKSRDAVQPLTVALEKIFDNAPVPVRAMTEKQWQLSFMQMLGNVKALIGSIGLATAFTLLLITGNTVAMNARERQQQAALLRVIGFQRFAVARLFLTEASFYGVFGAVLGVGLIFGFCKFVGDAINDTQFAGLGGLLKPGPETILASVAIAGVLAIAAGVVPALGLSRRPIVELLRATA